MAKFVGLSTLYNPAFIVRIFPEPQERSPFAHAELADGRIVSLGVPYEWLEEEYERSELPSFANADPTIFAVVFWEAHEDGNATDEVGRYPVVGWRMPDPNSDTSLLTPVTVNGEFEPLIYGARVAIRTQFGYLSLAGQTFSTEEDFVAGAREAIRLQKAEAAERTRKTRLEASNAKA